jgi:hypothetical protein
MNTQKTLVAFAALVLLDCAITTMADETTVWPERDYDTQITLGNDPTTGGAL